MSAGDVPDSGAVHPEAAGGIAFNGDVGRGVADVVLGIIAAQSGVRTICDLGCGNGYLAGQLGRRGFSVVGVDASDTYLQIARDHNSSDPVTFVKGLVDSHLPQAAAVRAPAVRSRRLERRASSIIYDPLEFLKTALALLRPGGTAVIGTPYHGYLKNVAISLTGKWDSHHSVDWHGGHIKFFSVPSLTELDPRRRIQRAALRVLRAVPRLLEEHDRRDPQARVK